MLQLNMSMPELSAAVVVITAFNAGIYWVFMKRNEEAFDKRYANKEAVNAELGRIEEKIDSQKQDFKEGLVEVKSMIADLGKKFDSIIELFIRKN